VKRRSFLAGLVTAPVAAAIGLKTTAVEAVERAIPSWRRRRCHVCLMNHTEKQCPWINRVNPEEREWL